MISVLIVFHDCVLIVFQQLIKPRGTLHSLVWKGLENVMDLNGNWSHLHGDNFCTIVMQLTDLCLNDKKTTIIELKYLLNVTK